MKHTKSYMASEEFLKMQLVARIITESEYRRRITNVKEAIVDDVSDQLSDIFDNPEDIGKAKMTASVKDVIKKGLESIQKQFPDVKILDHFVVGAAVTYQYSPESDIDTTVVLDKAIGDAKLKEIDKWIEQNLDAKTKHNGKRPFQFKVSFDGRDKIDNADSAYDPLKDTWIKQPDAQKAKEMFQAKIADPNSKENQLYGEMEKLIQPSLQRVKDAIDGVATESLHEAPADLPTLIQNAYARYDKVIKAMRGKAYQAAPESGFISQNWGKGNVIYKMFDREGYNTVFSIMKPMVKSGTFDDPAQLAQLKTALDSVVKDEPGYKP